MVIYICGTHVYIMYVNNFTDVYVMWWVLYTLKAPLYLLNLYFTSCTYLGKTQKKLPVGTQCNMMYHECHNVMYHLN